jgi:diguanylate cyclase (GGDEF)-like protein
MIAATLKSSVRKSDLVGRLGGDEFSVLLYDTDLQGAKIVADRMLEQLRVKTKISKSPIGFSIGVAVFGASPSSAQEAIKCADTLMYRAKKTGKNKIIYEVYS